MDTMTVAQRMHAIGGGGYSNMGELNPSLAALGYTEDAQGNVYYPDGTIMYGPAVNAMTRPRTMNSPISIFTTTPSANVIRLPTGQQVTVTPEQYQQYLASQKDGAAPGSLVSSFFGAGFEKFAAQFGVSSTTMVLLLAGGTYLLLREPPQRKR